MGSRKTVQMNRFAGQQWRAGTENRLRTQEGARRRGGGWRGKGEEEGRVGEGWDEWRQRPGNRYPPWNRGQ